ncbi:CamS family sex pheromone protein [Terrilactibacillus sp. BCM23-1]|uniref:CamS family sex pheromone protein n=1 Tax=Terrilactibacillus tamarindi TaxID=2599694 RepID=A0A6N8CWI6_9BACI|nr:CamS family sex pheromone protein [Terrilactibacillus tamarindi]MTT33026.1 CamS family sex pheromone protein [Terrilactibacillus tamarindi]
MKKWLGVVSLLSLSLTLVLSGCDMPWSSGTEKQNVIKSSKGDKQTATLIPKMNKKDYQSLKPTGNSSDSTRGYIGYGVNNRVDIDQLETGLMDMSKSVFSPDDYVFQSGQYLSQQDIDNMLYRKSKKTPNGLNPPLGKGKTVRDQAMNSPKILSYILEQDYLKSTGKNKYELGGISLAISLNQVYTDKVTDKAGKQYDVKKTLNVSQVKQQGKTIAQKVLQQVRQKNGLGNVPIFITLYAEAPDSSLVPGYFYSKTYVSNNSGSIGKWDNVKEDNVLFPSDESKSKYKSDNELFNNFKTDVSKYFPNFIGVIAKGRYENGDLADLNFQISIKFYDKTEVMGFASYVTSLVKDRFPFSKNIPVQISIITPNTQEAVIVSTPDMDEPFVHVFEQ